MLPQPEGPAGLDPAEAEMRPPAGRRGRLRRRLRYLRRARELMLRDLGGLVYEIHRTGGGDMTSHAPVVTGKVDRIRQLDAESVALETALGAPRGETVVFQPGIGGTCVVCGELYASDAHFCSECGTSTTADPAAARRGRAGLAPPVDPRGTLNLFGAARAERRRAAAGGAPGGRDARRAADRGRATTRGGAAAAEEPAPSRGRARRRAAEEPPAAERARRRRVHRARAQRHRPAHASSPATRSPRGSAREHPDRVPPQPVVEEAPAARQCPRCGAAMTDEQEWCLRCGAAVGTRIATAQGWRVPLVLTGLLVVLAAVADRHRDHPARRRHGRGPGHRVGRPRRPSAVQTAGADAHADAHARPGRDRPRRRRRRARPRRPPRPARPTRATPARSPSGRPARTAGPSCLASKSSEDAARDSAESFSSEGIPDVGILDSDDFSSLKGGFWVVYSGEFDTQAEATDALDGIDAPDAYIRRIAND